MFDDQVMPVPEEGRKVRGRPPTTLLKGTSDAPVVGFQRSSGRRAKMGPTSRSDEVLTERIRLVHERPRRAYGYRRVRAELADGQGSRWAVTGWPA